MSPWLSRSILVFEIALTSLPCGAGEIAVEGDSAHFRAGVLSRDIRWDGEGLRTVELGVDGENLLAKPAAELIVRVRQARPNQRPTGLRPGDGGRELNLATIYKPDQLAYLESPARWEDHRPNAVAWVDPVTITSLRWDVLAGRLTCTVSEPKPGVRRLTIRVTLKNEAAFGRLDLLFHYETYADHPVVRKWVEIKNQGDRWLMLDHLTLDDLHLAETFRHEVALTPQAEYIDPSVAAFGDAAGSRGIIAASEVPSGLRSLREDGQMGYSEKWFEWVLGPGETFVSEPVFVYAYRGAVRETPSARSTPLDRAVEGPYMRFLRQQVGLASEGATLCAPQWMTWAVCYENIDDPLVRKLGKLAGQAGFRQILLDDGWQKGRLGTEPDTVKFPDFPGTCRYLREQGLSLGLWVSCFRDPDSKDLRAMPDARSLPVVRHLNGSAMSYSSPWREYNAKDLVRTAREFGATYFKQDFINIRCGDFAEGHESRSLRDSLLRGLRGLLENQDLIRAQTPDVVTELTHEIYWNLPTAPCDVAALKHACQYHFPPNAGLGADWDRQGSPPTDPAKHRAELLLGCYQARQRFYAHRGLPLHCLEYYAAATYSVKGSLTPAVQDRQVVSWLMGAPLTFSGDLSTLSDENIAHYRRRFDLLKRLQEQYDIYRHFQFSGVPAPTDTDWHWWGKLNDAGCGAVVVVRGAAGAEQRAINIPWTDAARRYRVIACFSGADLGEFTGKELQERGVPLSLPPLGQEILELTL